MFLFAGDPDYGGYDVSFTLPLSGATVGLGNPPVGPGRATPFVSTLVEGNSGNDMVVLGPGATLPLNLTTNFTEMHAAVQTKAALQPKLALQPKPAAERRAAVPSPSSSALLAANSFSTGPKISTAAPGHAAVGRRLLAGTGIIVVKATEDSLDNFRRARQRAACSVLVNQIWQEQQTPWEVDVQRYREMVAPHNIVDILAEAAKLLNE